MSVQLVPFMEPTARSSSPAGRGTVRVRAGAVTVTAQSWFQVKVCRSPWRDE